MSRGDALPVAATRVFYEGMIEPRLDHPEGIAVHPDGSVWCGGERGQIYRIAADGSASEEIASTGGFCLGLSLLGRRRRLLALEDGAAVVEHCLERRGVEEEPPRQGVETCDRFVVQLHCTSVPERRLEGTRLARPSASGQSSGRLGGARWLEQWALELPPIVRRGSTVRVR